jgi:hypothetical protein
MQGPAARGQRGWKAQPDGKRVGEGIFPSIFDSPMRAPGSGTGEESLRTRLYGCAGESNNGCSSAILAVGELAPVFANVGFRGLVELALSAKNGRSSLASERPLTVR